MNKRLIWNFELERADPIELPEDNVTINQDKRWEARFFWPGDKIIRLRGLDETFLELSRYTIKHRLDNYLIFHNRDYNLKIRHQQLIYKPRLDKTAMALAFGKKRKWTSIDKMSKPAEEPLDLASFQAMVRQDTQSFIVDKEAVIYKFNVSPKVTMELARLKVHNQVYFSLNIESRAQSWVNYLSKCIVANKPPCDYVTFLKSITS